MRKQFRFVTEERVKILREHFIEANSLQQAEDILDSKDVKSGDVLGQEQEYVFILDEQTREMD